MKTTPDSLLLSNSEVHQNGAGNACSTLGTDPAGRCTKKEKGSKKDKDGARRNWESKGGWQSSSVLPGVPRSSPPEEVCQTPS